MNKMKRPNVNIKVSKLNTDNGGEDTLHSAMIQRTKSNDSVPLQIKRGITYGYEEKMK